MSRFIPGGICDIEPDQPWIAAQPRLLVTHIAVGVELDAGNRILKRALLTHVRQQLAVPQTAHRGRARRDSTRQQRFHLTHESTRDLGVHPIVDPRVKQIARHAEPDFQRIEGRWTFALLRRRRAASRLINLEGADYPAQVRAVARRGDWIDGMQPLDDGLHSISGSFFSKQGPKRGVRRNAGDSPALDDRVDVERSSSHKEREAPSICDVGNCGHRKILKPGERHLAMRGQDVDEVVWYSFLLGEIRFGHADVEPAVEISRIGTDDFPIERLGQRNAEGRLSCRCRTADDHDALACIRVLWRRSRRGASVVAYRHGPYYGDVAGVEAVVPVAVSSSQEDLDRVLRIFTQSLKVVTIAALSIVVLATGVWAFSYANELARPSDAGEAVMLTVFDDQTDAEIANELAAQGLIRSTLLFQGQFRMSGGALIPGTYTLRKGMSVPQIVDRITGAAPAEEAPQQASTAPESFDITIPEGWRIEQIAEEYERLGGEGGAEAFLDAVESIDKSQFDFLADLPPGESLEGFLFPDTYRFDGGNPTLNVATMLTNFGNKYTSEMRQRTQQMGLTIHDVLKVASLVEREAQLPEERPTIADVYLSRLEQSWRLDADPTVQYVLGTPQDWWPELSGDDLFVESPYNTYQNEGLPPGPIASPGFASIQAVLFPNDTPYMYFVAKCDTGEHAFGVTAEDQEANVEVFQNDCPD